MAWAALGTAGPQPFLREIPGCQPQHFFFARWKLQMSNSLKLLKGGCMGDYIGDYIGDNYGLFREILGV